LTVCGIVAEYNPFHTGHEYQIKETRRILGADCAILAIMSGNWVQQADCAIADKWTRARLALMGGADLVLELPTLWAASTAESFARGAMELLNATGVVDAISFGSECGSAEALEKIAACLDTPNYHALVQQQKDGGSTFAVCRQNAVHDLLGEEYSKLLSTPNNNLGIEYIRALNALGSSIRPITVLRRGAAHNSIGMLSPQGEPPRFISATQIRAALLEGNAESVRNYLVPGGMEFLQDNTIELPQLKQVERAMLARIRSMNAEAWAKLPDSGLAEGLPYRLEQAGRQCSNINHFFDLVKTKRYTHARLRRLVLWAFLGLEESARPASPPYLRVLGSNETGRTVLKEMKTRAALPVLTKPAQIKDLCESAKRVFEMECRSTDLYDLCFPTLRAPGREWNTSPVILK